MSNNWKLAAADFGEVLTLDPQMAEAQFREGESLLQLNAGADAAGHFQKGCDCDALVFRADSRINGIIRETGRQLGGPDLVLCDAAASLSEPGSIPGRETFYEHVHFNFDGNYRLAMLWAAQAERLLPEKIKSKAQGGWASQEVCEARLGLTDWNRTIVLNGMQMRLAAPPFNSQFNNEQRVSELKAWADRMLRQMDATEVANARALYTDAIARAPHDYLLHRSYGDFLCKIGDLKQALLECKLMVELMPRNPFLFVTGAELLEKQGELSSARETILQALNLRPRYAEAWLELGKLAALEGKHEEALQDYRRSAALQPNDPQTFLYMGEALATLKRTDESVWSFRRALELDGGCVEAHYALGGELGTHGRLAEAKEEFQQVVRLKPQFPSGHLKLGIVLLRLNDLEGARREFVETLRLDPANKMARTCLDGGGV